jgi:catechol 2,3-dioxygenase-like lactoylglutathione lyase family enzyme
MSVLRFTHIGICVADLDRSIRFYRDLLGFNLRSELRIGGEPTSTLLRLPDVDLHAVYLERDGMRIELLYYQSPQAVGAGKARSMRERGLTHLSLRVDNLADLLGELGAAGVEILDDSRIDFPEFQTGAVFVCDPDGTLIELVQSPGDVEAPPGA